MRTERRFPAWLGLFRTSGLLLAAMWFAAATAGEAPAALEIVAIDTQATIRIVRVDPTVGDLWLLTDGAIHHRRHDGAWQTPILTPGDGLASIYVVRPGLIYATTDDDEIVGYRDGRWSTIGKLANCAAGNGRRTSIDGRGGRVVAGCPYYSGLADWQADDAAIFRHRQDVAPQRIAVIDAGSVLTLGIGEMRLVRLDDATPPRRFVHDGARKVLWADSGHIVTNGHGNEFRHATWRPANAEIGPWTARTAVDAEAVADIGGGRHDDLVAVARGGRVWRFDGDRWTPLASPVKTDLHSVAIGDSGFWIGGDAGTLLHLPAAR